MSGRLRLAGRFLPGKHLIATVMRGLPEVEDLQGRRAWGEWLRRLRNRRGSDRRAWPTMAASIHLSHARRFEDLSLLFGRPW